MQAPLKAGGHHIPFSITVLESENMKFLFGLDNLKRHQCSIDLQRNCLTFPHFNLNLPFLAEHEIPKSHLITQPESLEGADQAGTSGIAAPAPVPDAAAMLPSTQHQSSSSLQEQQHMSSGMGDPVVPFGWEEKIERLMQLGFTKEQCFDALQAAQGNEEVAGSMLFGGM